MSSSLASTGTLIQFDAVGWVTQEAAYLENIGQARVWVGWAPI
jgi:hypothetical protein